MSHIPPGFLVALRAGPIIFFVLTLAHDAQQEREWTEACLSMGYPTLRATQIAFYCVKRENNADVVLKVSDR